MSSKFLGRLVCPSEHSIEFTEPVEFKHALVHCVFDHRNRDSEESHDLASVSFESLAALSPKSSSMSASERKADELTSSFRRPGYERPLSSEAVIQTTENPVIRPSANATSGRRCCDR
jgi:hypothetical protein